MVCNLVSLNKCVLIKHVKSHRMFQSPYNSSINLFIVLDMTHYITCYSDVIYIFVVNAHLERKDTVEKFRYDEKGRKLYHLRTYRDPTFTQSVFIQINVLNQS